MQTPAQDAAHMARAVELAAHGHGTTSPNPVVGCVVLDAAGQVAGEGFHAYAGGPHAEVVALAQAGERARGGTAYVTLEPCDHTGRTGPCSRALLAAGVARVVIAVPDPNPKAAGGAARLREHGVAVTVGVLAEAAERVNEEWLTYARLGRSHVTWKFAATLDGRSAAEDGTSKWITSPEARADVHRLRAAADAIIAGIGTVLADDPHLTARPPTATPVPGPVAAAAPAPAHSDAATGPQGGASAGSGAAVGTSGGDSAAWPGDASHGRAGSAPAADPNGAASGAVVSLSGVGSAARPGDALGGASRVPVGVSALAGPGDAAGGGADAAHLEHGGAGGGSSAVGPAGSAGSGRGAGRGEGAGRRGPVRVVVDAEGRTPPFARVLDDQAPTLIAVAEDADPRLDADLLRLPRRDGGLDLEVLLRELAARDVVSVFLEGGPTLAGAFVRHGLVDRVVAYLAPALLGSGRAALGAAGVGTIADLHRLRFDEVSPIGPDVRLVARPVNQSGREK
ncbi:bifunctional diaminohydroxyphosphoribosylaminopyrimidine deaminase/5-amino-6-(5-phosphoribosylamino)uracil reductase RibD [Nonomuraea sp. FMUSA5-5]|uniref:Riboflavin biosynthesis protein RibD n=1 Tax=Nonomuraea composti TaxID=2720023 RepID=A0ABX1BJY6_9ACTN|nr:bifunctional diaminohydroxyphosphoribosylaminopyrimidine deaminase/5-amino-6-(5-phosphoribosylamino)uracil reductase RibD [Nonomuraea sp. FMUSA5-5]NJP98036.1 bifunctional diaminohydroxyphosphoribosylaminopyrimidine deaminase/5-amino-6-(5-phosphoribosylamino)uracil reductase RibD [Nonomuraea sp. FMUSA5-5]